MDGQHGQPGQNAVLYVVVEQGQGKDTAVHLLLVVLAGNVPVIPGNRATATYIPARVSGRVGVSMDRVLCLVEVMVVVGVRDNVNHSLPENITLCLVVEETYRR